MVPTAKPGDVILLAQGIKEKKIGSKRSVEK